MTLPSCAGLRCRRRPTSPDPPDSLAEPAALCALRLGLAGCEWHGAGSDARKPAAPTPAALDGDRVRLFVLNAGPSKTSSFHVVGAIFDRIWWDGNPDNQFRGMQTVLLGSSSGAIVEFVIPEAGSYIMVDHHFANASQGAVGLIAAGGTPEHGTGSGDHEHHNIPATATPTDAAAVQGKLSFESKCLACHSIAGGDKLGPDLHMVTKRRDDAWFTRWMKDPEGMVKTDPIGKEMLAKYKVPMPNQNVSDQEIKGYLAYFKWADANIPPKPAGKPK